MSRLQKTAKSLECSIIRSDVSKNLNIFTKTSDIDNSFWWIAQRFRVDSSDNFNINDKQKRKLIENDYDSNQLYRVFANFTNSSMMKFQKTTKIESDTNDDKNQMKSIKIKIRQFETCDSKIVTVVD